MFVFLKFTLYLFLCLKMIDLGFRYMLGNLLRVMLLLSLAFALELLIPSLPPPVKLRFIKHSLWGLGSVNGLHYAMEALQKKPLGLFCLWHTDVKNEASNWSLVCGWKWWSWPLRHLLTKDTLKYWSLEVSMLRPL